MKYAGIILFSFFAVLYCNGQEGQDSGIFFRGIVRDASSFSPLPGAQIMVNGIFSAKSGEDGTFDFSVYRNDTITFRSLGYKPAVLHVADTLAGKEFITGVYMHSDTISIGEIIIVPGLANLKSEMLNPERKERVDLDNARYNVALSGYQGRNSVSSLGDPANNYAVLANKQKIDAFEKGGIPSDKIVGLSPLMLVPAAYMLIRGRPEEPDPFRFRQISKQEIDLVHEKYLETLR